MTDKSKHRRLVIPCNEVVKPRKSGGSSRIWAFSVSDIAVAVGKTEGAVRKDLQRGKLDPKDLASLASYVTRESRRAPAELRARADLDRGQS